jgi:hypothetical protein
VDLQDLVGAEMKMGVRVEAIEQLTLRKSRYLERLVDDLAEAVDGLAEAEVMARSFGENGDS